MPSTIVLINPNIVTQKTDVASSGIPYWPITLAYAAAILRQDKRFKVNLIDAFGEAPKQVRQTQTAFIQGLTPTEIINCLSQFQPEVIVTYAGTVMNHDIHLEIITTIKNHYRQVPLIVLENTQQVTSYKLDQVADQFLQAGADYIYSGEPEKHLSQVISQLINGKKSVVKKIPGIYPLATDGPIWKLDLLPYPAWDLFPVNNYWNLGYAHAPRNQARYLPMYTSRGCPFGCAFCTIPKLNNRLWRGRSATNIVAEMTFWSKKWGITEFHLEDVNPAIVGTRMVDLSQQISRHRLRIKWKIVSGTKVEALTPSVIRAMARSGCDYISISPESGSPRLLRAMNKPFSHQLALDLIEAMHKQGISTQACFVLGFPGETAKDLTLTWNYVRQLAKRGLDEIAPFIMTPIPGSAQWGHKTGYKSLSELTFSPVWRNDFNKLHQFRLQLFIWFNFWRLIYNPLSVIKTILGFITGRFYTKTEMTIHRLLKIRWWATIHPI